MEEKQTTLLQKEWLDKLAIKNKVISFDIDGVQVFKDVE